MKHIILASASVLAMVAGPALAQTAPSASGTENVQSGIEDIIVTAQRVEESAQSAPIAIAVVKPEEIVRQNITRAEDLSRVVPALVTTASGGPNTSFFVRGVGNTTVNSFSDPAISFNYDGVTIGRPNVERKPFSTDGMNSEGIEPPKMSLTNSNSPSG